MPCRGEGVTDQWGNSTRCHVCSGTGRIPCSVAEVESAVLRQMKGCLWSELNLDRWVYGMLGRIESKPAPTPIQAMQVALEASNG